MKFFHNKTLEIKTEHNMKKSLITGIAGHDGLYHISGKEKNPYEAYQ
ncbi:hypothetical protein [Thermodesulfovibrio aggregans]|nr:hypothetical protein [Thermodesulfovibrio aggregans]